MYADYSFYTGEFYGSAIAQVDFPRLASRATDFLDYYTRGKAAKVPEDDTATNTALAKACCAVAELIQTDEQNRAIAAASAAAALAAGTGEVKSETVGSHSVTYMTAADYAKGSSVRSPQLDARIRYADAAMEYLANTGLLYRGGC